MVTEGIALGSVVDIFFYSLCKYDEVLWLVLLSQLIGPGGRDERFLTIIGVEEFLAESENSFFVPVFYLFSCFFG
jgi:hypothetical protein